MEEIQKKMTVVKQRIQEQIRHPYLIQYIDTPVVDEDKLMLLLGILTEQDMAEEKVERYALSTMLVQLALDTHETVSNVSYEEEEYHLEKERQLTVLGGIYYSSLYYYLLAEAGNIRMARTLSIAIKEINEHKIYAYQKDNPNLEQLMNNYMKIEASLLEKVADYYSATSWKELASHFLFVKRLQKERDIFIKQSYSNLFEHIKRSVFPNEKMSLNKLTSHQQDHLIDVCDKFVNRSIEAIERVLKKSSPVHEMIEERIKTVIERYPNQGKTYVGEG